MQLRLSDGEVISETLVQEAYVEKTSYSGGTEFVIEGHLGATGASTIDPTGTSSPAAHFFTYCSHHCSGNWRMSRSARDAVAPNNS